MRGDGGRLREGMLVYLRDGQPLGTVRSWGSSVVVIEDENGRTVTAPLERVAVSSHGVRLLHDDELGRDAAGDDVTGVDDTLDRDTRMDFGARDESGAAAVADDRTPATDRDAPSEYGGDETVTLERSEEQLNVEKLRRQAGTVHVARETVEETEEVRVTLAHDEVRIERTPADRPLGDEAPVATEGQATRILVVEERLEVRKVPWVVEEIRVFRGIRREERTVADTVRKERVRIDPEGDVRIRDESTSGSERAADNEETAT